jgi:hypothetical protein
LIVDGILMFLSLAGRIVAHMRWAPMVFLSVFRLPGTGLLGAVMTPQALFSPLFITVFMSLWPVLVQVWCWFLIWPVMRHWQARTRLMYFLIALIPIFGPAGAYNLMKTQEDFALD